MLKVALPLIIIFVAALLSLYFISAYFTLRLDLSKVFKTSVQPAPSPATGGISVRLGGIDGDSAIIGFQFPATDNSSEDIPFTEKNLEEIRSSLTSIESDQIEFLTGLPASIFRFNLYLVSYKDSPNKAKKASYFLVRDSSGSATKVLPDQSVMLAKNITLDNLVNVISLKTISLIYTNGMYQNFYDQGGNIVSQATGELVIKPTVKIQFLIFLGLWTFIIAFLTLLKQTIGSSKDLQDVIDLINKP